MSAATSQLVDRYRALPRAGQWGILALIGIVAFLVWDATIRPVTDDLNRRSERIESDVAKIRAGVALVSDLDKVERVVESLGPVKAPAGQADGRAKLVDTVTGVLQKYAIKDDNFGIRGGKLPTNTLAGVTGGKRPEKLVGDLRFTASTEDAMAVIAELETSPEIEMIKSLRMTKDANRKVKVNLSIEAWVMPSDSAAGGGA